MKMFDQAVRVFEDNEKHIVVETAYRLDVTTMRAMGYEIVSGNDVITELFTNGQKFDGKVFFMSDKHPCIEGSTIDFDSLIEGEDMGDGWRSNFGDLRAHINVYTSFADIVSGANRTQHLVVDYAPNPWQTEGEAEKEIRDNLRDAIGFAPYLNTGGYEELAELVEKEFNEALNSAAFMEDGNYVGKYVSFTSTLRPNIAFPMENIIRAVSVKK